MSHTSPIKAAQRGPMEDQTVQTAVTTTKAIATAETISAALKRSRRRREAKDDGTWLGIGEIKQMVGGDREAVRGELIALVASGEVEVSVCTNGTFWRSAHGLPVPPRDTSFDPDGGHYILQRELMDGRRGHWFDAETFDNLKRAQAALRFTVAEEASRSREYNVPRAIQRIRLLQTAEAA